MEDSKNRRTASLEARSITLAYGSRLVVDGLSVAIEPGTVTALVGPNGSGKSTLLKAMARLLRPAQGVVYLDGRAIAQLPTAEVARRLAVLPQAPLAPGGITVRALVEQGRYPHVGALRMLRRQDHEAIREALRLTGMEGMADRALDSLSGGERQRAWIALALAQATGTLLLDEPTTFLDIGHQLEVLTLVRRLNVERGMTIVMVLHDLNQAARYADRVIALKRGAIIADGAPGAVVTREVLAEVFGVDAFIMTHPETGTLVCIPYNSLGQPQPKVLSANRICRRPINGMAL